MKVFNKRSLLALAVVMAMLSLAGRAHAVTELVANGGFETGDFTGWTQSGNTSFDGVETGNPHSGTHNAFFGPVGSLGFISQTLSTTPGAAYDINFFLDPDGGTPSEFQVQWDGGIINDQFNLPNAPYTAYHFVEVASGASTELKFGFRNDPGFTDLDDVSVQSSVPEPVTAAMGLLSFGGIALTGLRRRRNA